MLVNAIKYGNTLRVPDRGGVEFSSGETFGIYLFDEEGSSYLDKGIIVSKKPGLGYVDYSVYSYRIQGFSSPDGQVLAQLLYSKVENEEILQSNREQ